MHFALLNLFLHQAMQRAIEVHGLCPEHFVAWTNRLGLFDDVTLLIEGVRAWYQGDLIKAVHVLVPQIELGLRSVAGKLGQPVTKDQKGMPGVSVAIGMGEILSEGLADGIGPDFRLYLRARYAEPRGINLRNDLAHGLLKAEDINETLVAWLIHTLLIFGIWDEIARSRRQAER